MNGAFMNFWTDHRSILHFFMIFLAINAAKLFASEPFIVGNIDNQAMLADSTINFTVGTNMDGFKWAATSDNETLLPESNILVSNRGTNGVIHLKAAGLVGAAKVNLSASGPGQSSATASFIVAVCNSTNFYFNTAALREALGAGKQYTRLTNANTRFAPGTYHLYGLLETSCDNQRLYADQGNDFNTKAANLDLHFPANQISWGLLISHSGCFVENIGFKASQAMSTTYLILLRSKNPIVHNSIINCGFYGSAGNFLRDEATATDISGNVFKCENEESVMEALSINNDPEFNASGNRFYDIGGFSLKVRGKGYLLGATSGMYASGTIVSNSFTNSLSIRTTPFISGVADYNFSEMHKRMQVALWVTNDNAHQCWGLWGGGRWHTNSSNWTYTVSGNSISVHLYHPNIVPSHSSLLLMGWHSLEHINIDGGSTNIAIRHNIFNGTGDSAITVCNDFRMTPPSHIVCEDNYFQDIACAGIYFQSQSGGCVVKHNTFLRTGLSNVGSHYDAYHKEWNGQIPWSTCVFDPTATDTKSDIDYGAPNYSNILIKDPLNPECTRTSNNLDLSSPWCHQNPF